MIKNHLLSLATQRHSPNYNNRPNGEISLIVIHNISLPPGQFGGGYIDKLFTNQLDYSTHPSFGALENLRVSAHLLIKRGGDIVQFVAFDKRAWHAGESNFKGRENCNDFSIGIELEGVDDIAYEPVQYKVLKQTIKLLKAHYLIDDIVGHNHIAPKRKTDPGPAFKWEYLNDTAC